MHGNRLFVTFSKLIVNKINISTVQQADLQDYKIHLL